MALIEALKGLNKVLEGLIKGLSPSRA